jgi:uncharacterized membrane protein
MLALNRFLVIGTFIAAAVSIWQAHIAQTSARAAEAAVTVASNALEDSRESNRQQAKIAEEAREDAKQAAESSAKEAAASLQSTIDDAHQELRAWVALEGAKPTDFSNIGGQIQLNVNFTLRNYGRSIAEEVEIYPRLEILTPATRKQIGCRSGYPKNDLGYNLLPSEQLQGTWALNVSPQSIRETIRSHPRDRNIFLEVAGCVVYREGGNKGAAHHTPFYYGLELTDRSYVTADTLKIPDERMELKQMMVYPGPAD